VSAAPHCEPGPWAVWQSGGGLEAVPVPASLPAFQTHATGSRWRSRLGAQACSRLNRGILAENYALVLLALMRPLGAARQRASSHRELEHGELRRGISAARCEDHLAPAG